MEVKKGDKIEITFCPQKEYIGKRGTIAKTVTTSEGITLYKVRCSGKVIRDYATRDCFKTL